MGAPAPPGRIKTFSRRNLQGKFVSAPPADQVHSPGRARVNFMTLLAGGGDLEVGLVHLVPEVSVGLLLDQSSSRWLRLWC